MKAPPPWKKLALELREHGIDSRYIARIEARVSPEDRLATLELEIAQEMAGALGRTEDRLNVALAELELCEARHARALAEQAPEHVRKALIDAHDEARKLAQQRLRELLIQREAMGFRRNQILYELYPIPAKLPR